MRFKGVYFFLYASFKATKPKPDLLIHEPGAGRNCAVIEVKSAFAPKTGIRKDLETLSLFRNYAGYQRAIYLVYGQAEVLFRIQECADALSASIEVWLHREPKVPATLLAVLTPTG